MQHYTLTYDDIRSLMRELKTLGATNALSARSRGLTGRATLQRLARAYEQFRRDGRLPATFEVIFAHAWVPQPGARPQDGSTVGASPLRFFERPPKVGP